MRNLTRNLGRIAALFGFVLLLLVGSHLGAQVAATEPSTPDAPGKSERAFKVKNATLKLVTDGFGQPRASASISVENTGADVAATERKNLIDADIAVFDERNALVYHATVSRGSGVCRHGDVFEVRWTLVPGNGSHTAPEAAAKAGHFILAITLWDQFEKRTYDYYTTEVAAPSPAEVLFAAPPRVVYVPLARPATETDELRREVARLKAENEMLRLKLENATLRIENEALRRELTEAGNKAITRPTPSDAAAGSKPDLVITDIIQDGPYYIKVKYKNVGGPGSGDFLIKITSAGKSYPGNSFYRFPVPPPGQECATGGFTMGLIGLHAGMEADVTAEIDWEHRVDESDRSNNLLTKHLVIK